MRRVLRYQILGIPVIPTLVGSFILLSTMFMWYGSFFRDTFQSLVGITEEQVSAESLGIWYPMGFLFAGIQGIGIATLLKWRGWPRLVIAVRTGAIAALLLGAMVFTYPLVILPAHSITLFLINASGLLVAWTLAAVTISLLLPSIRNTSRRSKC